jgi:tellurite methyltransferase
VIDWRAFHRYTEGREPRPLFVRATELLGRGDGRTAIEIGFGDGTESLALLADGWSVVAVDPEPSAADRLMDSTPVEERPRLRVVTAPVEDVELPMAAFVYAGYSLPFCHPDRFPSVWDGIRRALQPDGVFAGELFGDRDSWSSNPDMTFVNRNRLNSLLAPYEVLHLEEEDEDGDSFSGPKHWHVFHVVASSTPASAARMLAISTAGPHMSS